VGHTYGCHDIWQLYSAKKEGVNRPHMYWQKAMDLPGANQMKYVRRLMEAFPLLERIPDQSIIEEKNMAAAERIQATRGEDYLMVYSTTGKPFTVHFGKIKGAQLKGFWYNPRTGEVSTIEATANTGSKKFTPPTSNYGQDWVLALFDVAKNYEVK
jgi:hypothetical protein